MKIRSNFCKWLSHAIPIAVAQSWLCGDKTYEPPFWNIVSVIYPSIKQPPWNGSKNWNFSYIFKLNP